MAEAAYAPVTETLAPVVGPTPEEIERRKLMAAALLKDAMGSEPIGHWTQGVSNIVQALVAGRMEKKAGEEDAAAQAETWRNIAASDLFGGGGYGGDTGGGETAEVPGAEAVSSAPASDVEAYIRQSASARGIDPNVAVRVAKSEGLAPGVWQSRLPNPKGGGREPSYGPFQLYTGGGLGNVFQQQTGLDPRDPSTVKQQIDFALDQARKGGWTPWHGAKRVGIGAWQGIGRGETAEAPNAEPVSAAPSPDVMAHIAGGGATPAGLRIEPAVGDPAVVPAPALPSMTAGRVPDPRLPITGAEAAVAGGSVPAAAVGAPDLLRYPPQRRPVYGATPPRPIPEQIAEQAALRIPPVPAPPPSPAPRAVPEQLAEQALLRQQPPPPVAAPPVHPLARVPQARPAAPDAPAAPTTTGAVAAPTPARPVYSPPVKNDYNAMPGRPPAALPMRPGQLMQEPYSGPMSAQEFARQGQAAMRARAAGQQPTGLAQFPTPGGQPAQPRRNLLQALLGRGGPQGQAGTPAAPVASGAPAGGTAAPMDPQRAAMARLLADPRVPDALKVAALKRMTPQEKADYTLGDTRYSGRTNQPIATQGDGPDSFGNSVEGKSLDHLVEQGILTRDQAAEVGAGKSITGPNGEMIFMTPSGLVGTQPAAGDGAIATPGRVITSPRVTEDQRRTAGFHSRLQATDRIIREMEQAGLSDWNQGASQIPVIGNRLVSTEFQQLEQAQRDFINAQLRRESGAVISEAEFENARRQYFPIPGDDPKTLKNKADARRRAIENMKTSSAATPVFAQPEGEAVEVDANGVPVDVDPNTWKYMTPEQQQEYLHG